VVEGKIQVTRFSYSAIPTPGSATSGQPGVVQGKLEASDEQALRKTLRDQGLIPIQVRPVSTVDAVRSVIHPSTLRRGDMVWFFQTLQSLLAAKVPIETALSTMNELAPKPRLAQACAQVRQSLRGGSSLADAVASIRGLAQQQDIAMLRIGHESGRLHHVVELIDKSITERQKLRKTVISRLVYPAVLFIAALGAVSFLSWFVIPQFAETLDVIGAQLPLSTRITLAVSNWLVWVFPLGVMVVGLVVSTRSAKLPPAIKAKFDRTLLRLPLIGSLVWHSQAAIVADTLATIIEGGGDVLAGLEQAQQAMTSSEARHRLQSVLQQVREGKELGAALQDWAVMPPMIAAVVRVGMGTGDLVGALRRATKLCSEKQEQITAGLLTLIEPATILFLAAVIGWLIYSLIAGMLTINQVGSL